MILETKNLLKQFGGVKAVNYVNLFVKKGEIFGMIGPNGSGKTTFINVLSGIYASESGEVFFNGENITGLKPHIITRKGITRTFQNLRIFPTVTVLENVLIGMHCKINTSLFNVYLTPFKSKKEEVKAKLRAFEILDMVNLADKAKILAKNLPYGEQRLLEICRALASDPKLLLLDEPCAGMNPLEMDSLAVFIKKLKKTGLTTFIIEHNMRFIMAIAERMVVLNAGAKFREGLPEDIQKDAEVQKIYLGEEEEEI